MENIIVSGPAELCSGESFVERVHQSGGVQAEGGGAGGEGRGAPAVG